MKIALTLSILAAGVLLAVENSEPDAKTKVKPLQNELISTLKEVADIVDAQAKADGLTSTFETLQVQRPVLDAQLEAAETIQDRINAHKEIVELQKKIEVLAEGGKKTGEFGTVEYLKAKAERLKAEIALEKAKSNGVK